MPTLNGNVKHTDENVIIFMKKHLITHEKRHPHDQFALKENSPTGGLMQEST